MTIEFSNVQEPKNHSTLSVALVVAACAFFFIPTSLIVLGYYSSRPTGTLISPLPQGTVSETPKFNPSPVAQKITPIPTETLAPTPTPAPVNNEPIIAAGTDASDSAFIPVDTNIGNNIVDKVATLPATKLEVEIVDPDIKLSSQIYLSPRLTDKSSYSVKSKGEGKFTIVAANASDVVRYIDYQIVNP